MTDGHGGPTHVGLAVKRGSGDQQVVHFANQSTSQGVKVGKGLFAGGLLEGDHGVPEID